MFSRIVSQSVSLTQYMVLFVCQSVRPPIRLFQLALELSSDVEARRRSDYCPRGAIFCVEKDFALKLGGHKESWVVILGWGPASEGKNGRPPLKKISNFILEIFC